MPMIRLTPERVIVVSVTAHHPTYQIIGSVPYSSFRRHTRRVFRRIETSLSGSLRSPNLRAPTGHASTHAVVLPLRVRWTQKVHFSTTPAFCSTGTSGLRSSLGTSGSSQLKCRAPYGHVTMQLRHAMHLSYSIVTMPSGSFHVAFTGQP